MNLYTSNEIKIADNEFTENNFDKLIALIKRAGEALFESIPQNASKVCVVSGSGNNGADGLACALKLAQYGYNVSVYAVSRNENYNETVSYFIKALDTYKITVNKLCGENTSLEAFSNDLSKSDVVLDCLLGTGFKGELAPLYEAVINQINLCEKYIISADIASGVSGDSGAVYNTAVKADKTVAFVTYKTGNIVYPGKKYCGNTVIADIGMPEIKRQENNSYRYFGYKNICNGNSIENILDNETLAEVKMLLGKRPSQSHKGDFGKVLIIGGSEGMCGAAAMAAKAAAKSGTGITYIASPRGLLTSYEATVLEAVKLPLGEASSKHFKPEMLTELQQFLYQIDVAVIGPGLGRNPETIEFVRSFIREANGIKLVIDADALFAYRNDIVSLSNDLKDKDFVITPHDGEYFNLQGRIRPMADRINAACESANQLKGNVLLKGASTIVASNEGDFTVNGTGNSGMATGGSGDVLSGIIAGIAASAKADMYTAASAGAFIHGLSGDIAKDNVGEISLTAIDILDSIPQAFKRVVSYE